MEQAPAHPRARGGVLPLLPRHPVAGLPAAPAARLHQDVRPGELGLVMRRCECGTRLPTMPLRAAGDCRPSASTTGAVSRSPGAPAPSATSAS